MADLLIPNFEESLLHRLRMRASAHGATAEAEAKTILAAALGTSQPDPWGVLDSIREQLKMSGKVFGDSTELLREDRSR